MRQETTSGNLTDGYHWEMILCGLMFLLVLWMETLSIFLLVFPLKFVYKNALEYSDSVLPMDKAQIVLSYRKVEISPSVAKFRWIG